MQRYWNDPSEANRLALRALFTPAATRFSYVHGTPDPALVAPENWALDQVLLERPGNLPTLNEWRPGRWKIALAASGDAAGEPRVVDVVAGETVDVTLQ